MSAIEALQADFAGFGYSGHGLAVVVALYMLLHVLPGIPGDVGEGDCMDFLARWIGYTILTAGGVAVTLALCWLVAEAVWRSLRGALNLADLREALEEWKTNHPERHAAWRKRNEGRESGA